MIAIPEQIPAILIVPGIVAFQSTIFTSKKKDKISFNALTELCLRAYLLRAGMSLMRGSPVSCFQPLIIIPAGWILLC